MKNKSDSGIFYVMARDGVQISANITNASLVDDAVETVGKAIGNLREIFSTNTKEQILEGLEALPLDGAISNLQQRLNSVRKDKLKVDNDLGPRTIGALFTFLKDVPSAIDNLHFRDGMLCSACPTPEHCAAPVTSRINMVFWPITILRF